MFKKNSILLIIFCCILIFGFSYYKTATTDENSPTIATISTKDGYKNYSKCSN